MTWHKQKCDSKNSDHRQEPWWAPATDLYGGCLLPKFNSKFYVSFLNFGFHQILRLPNFNMLFHLVLTKFFKSKLFSCLPKVDHVMTVIQSAYQLSKREGLFTLRPLLVQGSGGTSSLQKLQVFTSSFFSSFPFLFFLPFSLHSSFPFFSSFCSFISSSFLFSSSSPFSSPSFFLPLLPVLPFLPLLLFLPLPTFLSLLPFLPLLFLLPVLPLLPPLPLLSLLFHLSVFSVSVSLRYERLSLWAIPFAIRKVFQYYSFSFKRFHMKIILKRIQGKTT